MKFAPLASTKNLARVRSRTDTFNYKALSSQEGGEGPPPYEVLLHAAMVGDIARFKRQDSVEETWRVFQPLLDSPPPVQRYPPGTWGPAAANELVADHGGWHEPWTTP